MSIRIERKIQGLDRIENEPNFPPPVAGDDEYRECTYIICRDCANWKKGKKYWWGYCKKKRKVTEYADSCEGWQRGKISIKDRKNEQKIL